MTFQNEIRALRRVSKTELMRIPNHYELKKLKGGKGVIARFLWSTLHKMGALASSFEEIETVTYHNLQSKVLLDEIIDLIHQTTIDFPYEKATVVIGSEDFDDLIGSPEIQDVLSYTAGPFKYGRDPQIYGCRVMVIPWLKGWAVIPG